MKTWFCKIGETDGRSLPDGADAPMRKAVREAYFALTGEEDVFLFSGWGAELTEEERAVVENRDPRPRSPVTDDHEAEQPRSREGKDETSCGLLDSPAQGAKT